MGLCAELFKSKLVLMISHLFIDQAYHLVGFDTFRQHYLVLRRELELEGRVSLILAVRANKQKIGCKEMIEAIDSHVHMDKLLTIKECGSMCVCIEPIEPSLDPVIACLSIGPSVPRCWSMILILLSPHNVRHTEHPFAIIPSLFSKQRVI